MIAIEIRLNGKLKAVCGAEDLEQVVAVVRADGKLGENSSANEDPEYELECLGIHVNEKNTKEVLKWVGAKIRPSDEISFKFVETDSAHQPIDKQEIGI